MDKQTEAIFRQLCKLDDRQIETLAAVNELKVQFATVNQRLAVGEEKFNNCSSHTAKTIEIEKKVDVIEESIRPVHRIVYGAVSLILTSVMVAIIVLVVKR